MRFKNRSEAGKRLAAALLRYRDEKPVVMALPRGGVPVAAEVARAFGAPLGVILVRKIGAPSQPELALGAVVDGANPVVVRNDELIAKTGTSPERFDAICTRELAEIERRRGVFLGKRGPLDVSGRVIIVVDDGVATGATMRVALQAMRMHNPRKLVAAVPVAATDAIGEMRELADDAVWLADLEGFGAVGMFYDDFRQLEDKDVIDILAEFPEPARPGHPAPLEAEEER
jgi:putative phosphoribosyl transferase